MDVRAGQLRERVTIQEQVAHRSSSGAEVIAWSDMATVWASVEPVSGNERWIAGLDQRLAERTVRIRLRYRTGVTEKMRVVFGERVFDIQQVIHPWTRRRELYLICREVHPDE